jgi:hypothetical protein
MPIVFKSNLWLKWTLLLVLWILSFLILIIVSITNELNTLYSGSAGPVPEFKPPKNQIGRLSYTHSDPKENYRPVYSVSFGGLLVENNSFGLFETAAHKVVKIRDLKLAFHRYTPHNTAASAKAVAPDVLSSPEGVFTYTGDLLDDISNLISPANSWRINIDVSNTTEVCVAGLDYKVFCDGTLLISVRSRRAMISSKRPDVVTLRGRVIVEAADGSILESNRVVWDIRKNHFKVEGTYFLSRNGGKIHGKDICVDDKLNIVQTQVAALKDGGEENG